MKQETWSDVDMTAQAGQLEHGTEERLTDITERKNTEDKKRLIHQDMW